MIRSSILALLLVGCAAKAPVPAPPPQKACVATDPAVKVNADGSVDASTLCKCVITVEVEGYWTNILTPDCSYWSGTDTPCQCFQ